MKRRILATLVALVFVLTLAAAAQQPDAQPSPKPQVQPQTQPPAMAAKPPARPEDVKSIEAIIAALYDVISGTPGPRDWNRFHSLFLPEAHMAFSSKRPNGTFVHRVFTPKEYVERSGPYLEKEGFFETGIANKIDSFGTIAHVFGTYESRHEKNGKPFARGINSIQLLTDGTRWWVVTVMWDEERPDNPIPEKYLSK
ncbi:MAG TPA: hypothetical protein VN622_06615 [Clostridia bacterium]|nr:hypothetical protein [Clostridia bacterium]